MQPGTTREKNTTWYWCHTPSECLQMVLFLLNTLSSTSGTLDRCMQYQAETRSIDDDFGGGQSAFHLARWMSTSANLYEEAGWLRRNVIVPYYLVLLTDGFAELHHEKWAAKGPNVRTCLLVKRFVVRLAHEKNVRRIQLELVLARTIHRQTTWGLSDIMGRYEIQ